MESGEVLNIVEQFAPTGKTAKFVNDNVTGANNLKIVTSDPICRYILQLVITLQIQEISQTYINVIHQQHQNLSITKVAMLHM